MKRHVRSFTAWGVGLLVFGFLLQLSGVELALHEAAERDCSDRGGGVCILCMAPTTAPASLAPVPAPLPAPVLLPGVCIPAHPEFLPVAGAHPVPGRSPPSVLPA